MSLYLNHQEVGVDVQVALREDADTSHETAEDWYESFGAHVSTEHHGDVCIQAIDYDWLDDDDAAVIEKLMSDYDHMSKGEASELVERARGAREGADDVCGLLDDAVTAYESGDLALTITALEAAARTESDYGDDPATRELAERLLVVVDDEE